MAKSKIVKIELQTSFVGDNEFESLAKQIVDSETQVGKLNQSFVEGKRVLKAYNSELQTSVALLASLKALKGSAASVIPAPKQKRQASSTPVKDTGKKEAQSYAAWWEKALDSVDTGKRREIEMGQVRWQASQRAEREKADKASNARRVANVKATTSQIITVSENVAKANALTGTEKKKANLLIQEQGLKKGLIATTKKLQQQEAEGILTANKFGAERTKATSAYRKELTEIRQELHAVQAQEKLGAELAKERIALNKQEVASKTKDDREKDLGQAKAITAATKKRQDAEQAADDLRNEANRVGGIARQDRIKQAIALEAKLTTNEHARQAELLAAGVKKHKKDITEAYAFNKKLDQDLAADKKALADEAFAKDMGKVRAISAATQKRLDSQTEAQKLRNSATKAGAFADIARAREQIQAETATVKKEYARQAELKAEATKAYKKDVEEAYALDKDLNDKRKVARTQELSDSKRTSALKIGSIKDAIQLEISEEARGVRTIEAIKLRSAIKQKELRARLDQTLANAQKGLTGAKLTEVTDRALTRFADKSRDLARAQHNQVTEITNRTKRLADIKKQGLKTTQATISAQKALTAATNGTGTAAERLLRTNKTILRHTLEIVAGYRLVNAFINRSQEALINVPKQGVESQANLAALVGSFGTVDANKEIALASELAEKYGANLRSLEVSLRKFAPSALLAGASLKEVNSVFDDFTAVSTVLHKTGDEMESIFLALEQMFAKGTVQSEEIKKQLGNQLPAAVEIGAEAMNMSVSSFLAAMKRNEIIAKDFVPAFAELYRTIFSGEGDKVLNSLADKVFANYQRVLNRYTELNRAVFGKSESLLNVALKQIGSGISFVTENLNTLILTTKLTATAITSRLVVALASSTQHMIANAIVAERAANAQIASKIKLIAATRTLTIAETASLASATASRSSLALATSSLAQNAKGLIHTLTGLRAVTLGWFALIPAGAIGLAHLSGATLDYTKATSQLVGGNEELTKSLASVSTSYVAEAQKILKVIRELNSEDRTQARDSAIAEQVGVLSRLGEEYGKIAVRAGIAESQGDELVDNLTKVASEYAKATSEAKNLSDVELQKVNKEFEARIVKIAETTSALEKLSEEYANSQREAEALTGNLGSEDHYARLKEASLFALEAYDKQKRASKDFFLEAKEHQLTLTSLIVATGEVSKRGFIEMGKLISEVWGRVVLSLKDDLNVMLDIIGGTLNGVLTLAKKSISGIVGIGQLGTSLVTSFGDVEGSIAASNKAILGTEAAIEAALGTIGKFGVRVGKDLEAGFKGLGEFLVSPIVDEAISNTSKEKAKFLNEEIARFMAAFSSETGGTVDSEDVKLKARVGKITDETKAELEYLKSLYAQDFIDLTYYYDQKSLLEEESTKKQIEANRKLQNQLLASDEDGAGVKAKELEKTIQDLTNKGEALRTKTEAQKAKDKTAFINLVELERVKYLELTGQLREAAIARAALETPARLKAGQEAGSADEELNLLGKELEKLQVLGENRLIQQGTMAAFLKRTSNAQEELDNARTLTAAREKTATISYLDGILARTSANEAFLTSQRQVLAETEAGYRKEADLNGDVRRAIDASRASLLAFELESNEISVAVQGNLTDNLSTAFSDFITGAKSAGEAMQDFALSVLDSMAQIAANQLATQIIGGLFSLGGGAASSSLTDSIGATFSGNLGIGTSAAGNTAAITGATIPSFKPIEFAKGGIPDIGNKEATFQMGSLREGGKTEAIMPVYRTKDGDLGVKTSGGGGSGIAIGSININVLENKDSSVEDQAAAISKALDKQLKALMKGEIRQATRPGATLNPTAVTSIF